MPDQGHNEMNPARSSETRHDVDLQRARRTFLLAREQVAANTCAERYFAARATRRWAADHGRAAYGAADAPDSSAR
jgi:hypothetical protein